MHEIDQFKDDDVKKLCKLSRKGKRKQRLEKTRVDFQS